MFKFSPKDKKQLKVLGYISLSLLFFIFAAYCISVYFDKTIIDNWDNISADKNKFISDECINLFNGYQSQTANFSSELIRNKKLVSSFISQNSRKSYEYLLENEKINDYN